MVTATSKSASLPAFEPARRSLAELRAAGDRFAQFVSQRLDQLDELRAALALRERAVDEREREAAASRERLDRSFERLQSLREAAERGVLHAQQEARRLAEVRAQLHAERPASSDDGDAILNGEPGAETARDAAQCRRLGEQLAAARQQNAQLVQVALELNTARRELARTKRQLLKLQHRLAETKGHFEPSMRKQIAELRDERSRLLSELRELGKRLAESEAGDHTAWRNELARLRAAIERRNVLADRTEAIEAQAALATDADDPVLAMVLSQLEQIQHELHVDIAPPPRNATAVVREGSR
ncbi:MAG TPA: hypothetical protein VHZ24_10185 [Pirellulales bacterium]|nr:hypothetical protein [Pirellulales bacterium]